MKGEGEDRECSTLTEFMISVQAVSIGCGIVSGAVYLFFADLKASNFIFAGYLIAASSLIIGFVWLCKVFVDFVHWMLTVEDVTKFQNEYLIGFGTIGISTVVLRILTFFPELGYEGFQVTAFVYLFFSTSIYYFFIFQTFDTKCTWKLIDQDKCDKMIGRNVLINLVLLIVSIKVAVQFDDIDTREKIIMLQFFCTVPPAIIFGEFARVWWVGVQLIDVFGGRYHLVPQQVESRRIVEPKQNSKTAAPKPSCNICSIQYTETGITHTHTPRLIKECGHTICEQCADTLMNAKLQNFLICPFCQKPTSVNGPATTLPMNFALLEYSRDVVQRS